MKVHLGELLVDSGIITMKTLERSLERQKGSGKRLGVVLDEMGVITQEELAEALGKQFNFPIAKEMASREFSPDLLALIPEEIAYQRLVFPLKHEGDLLTVAVTDPFDTETLEYLAQKTSLKILVELATRDDIMAAIRQHYLNGEAGPSEAGAHKVLIADGSPQVTSSIESALMREGYEVLTANDGVEGLRIAFSQKPDLILCDAVMPRMDGYALMRAIKANPATHAIPMILLTSKASPEEEHRALKSGFQDFIAKPAMAIRVVARVHRAFEIVNQQD
ncbi:response regulator [Geomesophilobacter sediminis]|uniref:Response regulator n=1 Tax=Geomesophilobacter sediminis TaxID=2798584 RepID=A0A8J7M2T7_9BACT|nr:response regulator [Geomesophilobacter sediminis]MBJ6727607.1 response regulator [Geomesophilobacter sediminis]